MESVRSFLPAVGRCTADEVVDVRTKANQVSFKIDLDKTGQTIVSWMSETLFINFARSIYYVNFQDVRTVNPALKDGLKYAKEENLSKILRALADDKNCF